MTPWIRGKRFGTSEDVSNSHRFSCSRARRTAAILPRYRGLLQWSGVLEPENVRRRILSESLFSLLVATVLTRVLRAMLISVLNVHGCGELTNVPLCSQGPLSHRSVRFHDSPRRAVFHPVHRQGEGFHGVDVKGEMREKDNPDFSFHHADYICVQSQVTH